MNSPATMKSIRIPKFGGPEVLHLASVAVPTPGEGELLVKVAAAGVNPVDYKIRNGKYPAVKQDKLPFVLGREVAGTVVQCGRSASRFANGDAVEPSTMAESSQLREDGAQPVRPLSRAKSR